MLMFVIQHQPHRAATDLRRELVACLLAHGSTFSRVGASGKPGAVHMHSTARSSMNLMMLCRAEGVQARARTDIHSIWPSVVQVEAARTEETFREPWGAVN